MTEAIEEDPYLVPDYLMKILPHSPVSEFFLRDLYEYQIAKIKALEKVQKAEAGQDLTITPIDLHAQALNDATFRMAVKGEGVLRKVLTFSYDPREDGSIERSAL